MALLDKQIQFEKTKAESLSLEHSFQHEGAPLSLNVSSRAKLPKLPDFNDQRDCIDAYPIKGLKGLRKMLSGQGILGQLILVLY